MSSALRKALRQQVKRAPPGRRADVERAAEQALRLEAAYADSLLALLRDPAFGPAARATACWLLRALEVRRAIPALLRIARDCQEDGRLRHAAIQVLGMLGGRRVAQPLAALVSDRGDAEMVRRLAAQALGMVLGRSDVPEARDALLRVVKDADEPPEVRGDATEALIYFRDERAVPTLLEQLADPSPEVRFWAIFALGHLAGPEVIPTLQHLAETDDTVVPRWWSIRKEAQDAIRSIQSRAALNAEAGRAPRP